MYTKDKMPKSTKALPEKAQEIWMAAFNAAFKEYDEDEEKSFATAWAAVKKAGYEKDGNKWVLTEAKGEMKDKKEMSGLSMNELRDKLEKAIDDRTGNTMHCWIKDIYPDDSNLIYCKDNEHFKLNYSIDENGMVSIIGDPVKVEMKTEYVPISETCHFVETQEPSKDGSKWEVVIIQAGESLNGNYYSSEALQSAPKLFEGAKCYARTEDQHLKDTNASLTTLVGGYSNVREENGKLYGTLSIIEKAVREKLLEAWNLGMKNLFGLSIVAEGKVSKRGNIKRYVESFKNVISVDIVMNPAAGGEFVKLVASAKLPKQEEVVKVDRTKENALIALIEAESGGLEKLKGKDRGTISEAELHVLLSECRTDKKNADIQALLVETQKSLKVAECQNVLTQKLAAETTLPEITKDVIRESFTGKVFEPAELDKAIATNKNMVSKLVESGKVSGLGAGKIEAGMNTVDKLQAAMDKAFGLDVTGDAKHVPSFSGTGLRECYVQCTGNSDIDGRFNPNKLASLREAFDSSTFSYILGTSMNRRMLKDYMAVDYHERDIITIRQGVTNFKTQEAIKEGYFGDIATVDPETADYAELASYADEEATYSVGQKGNLVTITRKHIINDDLGRIVKKVSRLGRSARRTFARFVWSFVIDNATYGVDSKALFHADHGNLGSGALTYATLGAGYDALVVMTEPGSGEVLGAPSGKMNLFVPPQLRGAAFTATGLLLPGGTNNENNPSYGIADYKINPLFTDVTDWVLACPTSDRDIIEVAFLNGKEDPEVFVADNPTVGEMFTADKLVYKIRHEYGGAIVDYRGIYKAVVQS